MSSDGWTGGGGGGLNGGQECNWMRHENNVTWMAQRGTWYDAKVATSSIRGWSRGWSSCRFLDSGSRAAFVVTMHAEAASNVDEQERRVIVGRWWAKQQLDSLDVAGLTVPRCPRCLLCRTMAGSVGESHRKRLEFGQRTRLAQE
ncbi:hypothetical protein NL676_003541 [Syzygium grande]|nr:hypothetical protein NL676_003541 [Syzygium grande]